MTASTAIWSPFAETAPRTDKKVAQFCAHSLSAGYFGEQSEGANRPSRLEGLPRPSRFYIRFIGGPAPASPRARWRRSLKTTRVAPPSTRDPPG